MTGVSCAAVHRHMGEMRKLARGAVEVGQGNLNHTLVQLLVGTANPRITEAELMQSYWEHERLPKRFGCEAE